MQAKKKNMNNRKKSIYQKETKQHMSKCSLTKQLDFKKKHKENTENKLLIIKQSRKQSHLYINDDFFS